MTTVQQRTVQDPGKAQQLRDTLTCWRKQQGDDQVAVIPAVECKIRSATYPQTAAVITTFRWP